MSDEISQEVLLVGKLFRELYQKYSKMENKKHLYKDIEELTLIEIDTIVVIGIERKKSMSEIANSLGVSFGTPTVTIDRLIGKGYVERIRDEGDRRQVFVKLSEKGEQVHQSIIALKNKVAERVYGILEPEERDALVKILTKVNTRFDELFLRTV